MAFISDCRDNDMTSRTEFRHYFNLFSIVIIITEVRYFTKRKIFFILQFWRLKPQDETVPYVPP